MTATALDPKTALLAIDLQKGVAAMPTAHPMPAVIAKATELIDAFRAAKQTVVLVTVGFSEDEGDRLQTRADRPVRLGKLPPDFAELAVATAPGDLRIHKRQPNAFYGTELDLQLRRRGVTGVVLLGVATGSGVAATARAAQERGYHVTFAADAMSDLDAEVHEVMVGKVFPRLGEVDTVEAIVRLVRRAT